MRSFQFGSVTIVPSAYIVSVPLKSLGWRDLQEACQGLHSPHTRMLCACFHDTSAVLPTLTLDKQTWGTRDNVWRLHCQSRPKVCQQKLPQLVKHLQVPMISKELGGRDRGRAA